MSIEEYIQDKDNLTNSIESKINKSQKRLKSLMEDPKVIEYLKEEAELKRLEKKKYKKEKEFQLSYQETCVHPFFALIGYNISDTYIEGLYCIECGKKLDLPNDKLTKIETELFQQKRLLARYDSFSDQTGLPKFIPLSSLEKNIEQNIEIFRSNYYNHYLSIQKRIGNETLPVDYSIDDSFFNYFCFSELERFENDLNKEYQYKKIKTSY